MMKQNLNIPVDDAAGIIKLWQHVFGDSEQFIVEYLKRFATANNYIVKRNAEGEVIGMIHFPTLTDTAGHEYAYLYAVAVDARYRGQGIASAMIKQLIETTKHKYIATIPASETLKYWYAYNFGFETPKEKVDLFHGMDFDLGSGNSETDIVMVHTVK